MAICSFEHASLSKDRFIKETLKSIQNIWAIKCDCGDTPAREKERKTEKEKESTWTQNSFSSFNEKLNQFNTFGLLH